MCYMYICVPHVHVCEEFERKHQLYFSISLSRISLRQIVSLNLDIGRQSVTLVILSLTLHPGPAAMVGMPDICYLEIRI